MLIIFSSLSEYHDDLTSFNILTKIIDKLFHLFLPVPLAGMNYLFIPIILKNKDNTTLWKY